jgi:hypothetical protein
VLTDTGSSPPAARVGGRVEVQGRRSGLRAAAQKDGGGGIRGAVGGARRSGIRESRKQLGPESRQQPGGAARDGAEQAAGGEDGGGGGVPLRLGGDLNKINSNLKLFQIINHF